MSEVYLPIDAARADACQLRDFMRHAERFAGLAFADYAALHRWACEHPAGFWTAFLRWCDLPTSGSDAPALTGDAVEHARFFPGLRLNYAQCLLRRLEADREDRPALVFRDESGTRDVVSRSDLRTRSLSVAAALSRLGVGPGDRVVAIARNSVEAIVACLGCAAIGATWSSIAPDLGTPAALDRFVQLRPTILFADPAHVHHGAQRDLGERIRQVAEAIPSIRAVISFGGEPVLGLPERIAALRFQDLLASTPFDIEALEHFGFDHPLFILFSSGTTGAPKCLMHGAGGTLLEHLKEHRLHSDFGREDLLYFHTSTGWMMWNWMISGLASGMALMVFDGSATYPTPASLLEHLDQAGVTVFGTSPAYIQFLRDAGVEPREVGAFPRLRAIQSTGSILFDAQFDWMRDHFKHVPLQSISGGSDIVGCFVLGNPLLPVYRGESQSVSLGLDVRVMTDDGLARTGTGELVCVNPFPSRPVGIWDDAAGRRFHDSYFAQHEGMWTHGDRVELTDRGSARILGRSDGTLKVRGVRIGPAEIYSVVLAIPGIREAMAIEQEAPQEPGGSRVVLLVVLAPGMTLDRPLTLKIKRELRDRASAMHVPSIVAQVSGLPQTHNGKYSEKAAREAANGRRPANVHALRNPEVLDEIAAHPLLAGPRSAMRDETPT